MIQDTHQGIGEVSFRLFDSEGNLKEERTVKNLITSVGKAAMAGLLIDTGGVDAFSHIAIGTGTTAAVVGDTALETEVDRETATVSRVTTAVTDDTSRLVSTFSFSGSAAITESGVLNAGASGLLLNRAVFSAVNVSNGDSLQITWNIQHT